MQISKSCYAITGLACESPWSVNAGFIVGATHTLIVDTGANTLAAKTIQGYAQTAGPSNQLLVINTERHLDHIGGNYYLRQQGIEIYGHIGINRSEEDLAAAIEDYNQTIQNPVRRQQGEGRVFYHQTHITNPNRQIDHALKLNLGELEAEIVLTPGHTPTNLSVYVPSEGIVYCGDCLVSDYIPNLESGTATDWQLWEQSLDRLEALNPRVIVPGHGQILQGEDLAVEFARLRQFLKVALQTGTPPTLMPE